MADTQTNTYSRVAQTNQTDFTLQSYKSSVKGDPGLETGPQAYKRVTGGWKISETAAVAPITLKAGKRPEIIPVLEADGMVVKIGDKYLASPRTMRDLESDSNPHYDMVANGQVGNTVIGKSVPVVEINIANLKITGAKRDAANVFAGVKSVNYSYDTEPIPGTDIPRGIVEQINWTLNPNRAKGADTFTLWSLQPTGDYSVDVLKASTTQQEGAYSPQKLIDYADGAISRLKTIKSDFNGLKDIYYGGNKPSASVGTVTITKTAQTNDPDELDKPAYTKTELITTTTTTSTTTIKPLATVVTISSPSGSGVSGSTTTSTTTTTMPPFTSTQMVIIRDMISAAVSASIKPNIVADTLMKDVATLSGSEIDSLVARWRSYNWNEEERASLINNRPMPDDTINTVTIEGRRVNTYIVWHPEVCRRARLLGIITSNLAQFNNMNYTYIYVNNNTALAKEHADLIDFYGTQTNPLEYERLNRERKAQLLLLTDKMIELAKQGKVTL